MDATELCGRARVSKKFDGCRNCGKLTHPYSNRKLSSYEKLTGINLIRVQRHDGSVVAAGVEVWEPRLQNPRLRIKALPLFV